MASYNYIAGVCVCAFVCSLLVACNMHNSKVNAVESLADKKRG